ncbi:hypothetical protein JCM17845_25240 [Iodidimonas gelatinilytica]|uniref:Zinc resistance-associated protein n=1 Tax=Iodidimonas gelatinilytica TaxID=1236966 RepID=A0A5A7N0V1_9PROT|nr:periplasmic heavy metal sensor [Iodidimonas gelatinilytica]GER01901.1 hypothetical protein JCM17845_25240 [Iodidimonas gelatinilytica]
MTTGLPKWNIVLMVFLALSLAANVFFGSVFAGHVLFGPDRQDYQETKDNHGDRYSLRLELRALNAALSDEARKPLREELRQTKRNLHTQIDDLHQIRREIRTLLAAPQLDESALSDAFERLNTALSDLQRPLQGIIVRSASRMTPHERAEMARALARKSDDRERDKAPAHKRQDKKDQERD